MCAVATMAATVGKCDTQVGGQWVGSAFADACAIRSVCVCAIMRCDDVMFAQRATFASAVWLSPRLLRLSAECFAYTM